ncbi:hypothetical protein DFH28DRAFT_831963, partial [Melampsora americana]
GMRALARVQRGQEELRRVGWEVRRSMRWATVLHQQVWDILATLNHPDVDVMNVIDLEANDFASRISGDYQHLMPQGMYENLLERFAGLGVDEDEDREEEDRLSDVNEEDWEDVIDEGMMQNVLNVTGNDE